MKFALLMLILTSDALRLAGAQECPDRNSKEDQLRFLTEHHSNSLEADPTCVSIAFAELSHDDSFIPQLILLLNFERSTKWDSNLKSRESSYPAIGALRKKKAISYLISAIEEVDDEVVRVNAAEALDRIYDPCIQPALDLLRKEAQKDDLPSEKKLRLLAAAHHIENRLASRRCGP